jgi:thiol-disulfide isomerase/thioredoxin
MRKAALSLLAVCAPLFLFAQGLVFETGTFSEALEKAKKENKLVFVDVYTTWCGPCKQMAATLFPAKEAGDLYNAHFVNFKIDAEQGEGVDIATKYSVAGYPTNLFLKPDGSVVYTVLGAGDLAWFLNNGEVAIAEAKDPMKWSDYEASLSKSKDKAFLQRYLAKGKRLEKITDAGLDIYVSKYVSKKPSNEELLYLVDNVQTIDNKAYAVLQQNRARVDALKKDITPDFFKYYSESLLRKTIDKFAGNKDEKGFQKVVLGFVVKNSPSPRMDSWFYAEQFYKFLGDEAKIDAYNLIRAEEIMAMSEQDFLKEDNAKLEEALMGLKMQLSRSNMEVAKQKEYIEQTKAQNPQVLKMASLKASMSLNELAWNVYETNNTADLKTAIKWTEKALVLLAGVDKSTEVSVLDTYAHLLYRNDQKALAIQQQERALALSQKLDNKEQTENIQSELAKMKAGNL